jgi:hypothetical protein
MALMAGGLTQAVRKAHALFDERLAATSIEEAEAKIDALIRDEPDTVDEIISGFAFDEKTLKFQLRGRGSEHDNLRHYSRRKLVERAPASAVVDALRASVTGLALGYVFWHDVPDVPPERIGLELEVYPNLRSLDLGHVANIPALPRLTRLHVSSAAFETVDLSPFPALEELHLISLAKLVRIEGLDAVPRLRVLHLHKVPGLGTLALRKLANLEELDVSQAKIAVDITGLARLKKVQLAQAMTDLAMLEAAKDLDDLFVWSDGTLRSLHGLENHHALTKIRIRDAALDDVSALGGLAALKDVELGDVKSLAKLKGELPTVTDLTLHGSLETLAGIEALTAIEVLDLGECSELHDISALGAKQTLRRFWAMWTPKLRDLTPLVGHKKLTEIVLRANGEKTKTVPPELHKICDPMKVIANRERKARVKAPAAAKAKGAAKTQVAKLKKLLLAKDIEIIDQGVELAVTLDDPDVFAALLDGVTVERKPVNDVIMSRAGYPREMLRHWEDSYDAITANSVFQHGALLRSFREHALRALIANAPDSYEHGAKLREKLRRVVLVGSGKRYGYGPVDFRPCAKLPNLESLAVQCVSEIRGADHLAEMTKLERFTAWAGHGFDELTLRSKSLREVCLFGMHLTSFKGALPNVVRMSYDFVPLVFPDPLPPIEELHVGSNHLDAQQLDQIAALPKLKKLELRGTKQLAPLPAVLEKVLEK